MEVAGYSPNGRKTQDSEAEQGRERREYSSGEGRERQPEASREALVLMGRVEAMWLEAAPALVLLVIDAEPERPS